MRASNIVVGLGEVGGPLFEILSDAYESVIGIDPGKGVELVHDDPDGVICDFLHVCIPGGLKDFVGVVDGYLMKVGADVLIVHSTVVPGATRRINHPHGRLFHSPINGKHADMKSSILRHPKFLSCPKEINECHKVTELYAGCGITTEYLPGGTEVTELGKILATTAYGYTIAWAQEAKRLCDFFGLDMKQVSQCYEIFPNASDFTIQGKFPGVVGGHCVLPNMELLKRTGVRSGLLDWILLSNEMTKLGGR